MTPHKIPKCLILLVTFCTLSLPPLFGVPSTRDKIAEIARAEGKHDLFSGTVLVAKHGEILYAESFGYANRDHGVPNKLNTRFNIGSIGKTFTATLVMQLVQEGKIALTDPISKYLPEFPHPEKYDIQIQHLLNHSSGLANYMNHENYEATKFKLRRIDDVLPLIYDQKLLFKPGKKVGYSNSGMVLLGAIIEKIIGMEYKDYLKQRILDPLGMNDSGIVYPEEVFANRAIGYNNIYHFDDYQIETIREMPAFSDGGLYTTVEDLLKFDQALYGENLLDDRHKKIMFTPAGPHEQIACAWFVLTFYGTKVIYHGGGCPGFNAEFRRYPEKGYTVIVLSNYYGDPAFELTNKIEALLLGLPYELATRFDLNYRRGMYYQQGHKDYKKAIDCFARNLGSESHLPSLYQSARSKLLGEFDQEDAIEELDHYIALADKKSQPSVAAAWWRKGTAHEQLKQAERAIKCYEKCLALDPKMERAKEALAKLRK